ncbi:3-deoxy-D-manno-octulosonate cytidylyltransferase [Beggiatoa alba B18LD]|uniref:3-deoxy-manno-octulosonate cytidylyltransferase n=1 Tax=Beggiatoa alba B18LD TaxID=395493 RepID=I3CDG7_9GAMM|nr:3-deoxy-manno-octulosonate cytidylyltransferase [Beggiatoa alba]EIJ41660.1 3-deoxy-D-manno-octulosonate cytidylyltransferase [Beggiatoa alba B18LD]
MSFSVIIPARYASSRLPAKALADIAGQPMIWHVYQNAKKSGAKRVVIATDDARIAEVCRAFGAEVYMTATTHQSGTDRVAEAARLMGLAVDEILVNVQGDEPLLPAHLIRQVAETLENQPQADMATACEAIQDWQSVFNPNHVKVVMDAQHFALYFSRAPIPFWRDGFTGTTIPNTPLSETEAYFRHIGIYAYRMGYLQQYTTFPVCALEQAEALEQLRVLFQGGKIVVTQTQGFIGIGVDTVDDLAKVRALMTATALV